MKTIPRILCVALPAGLLTWALQRANFGGTHASAVSMAALPVTPSPPKPPTFDFRAAIQAALALSEKERQPAVAQVLEQSGLPVNADDAVWFLKLFLEEYRHGVPGIARADWLKYLNQLILQNPLVAAEMLLREHRIAETGADQDGALLMSVWAGLNPQQAIAWGKSGGKEREEWLRRNGRELAQGWASADLPGLLDYLAAGGTESSVAESMTALEEQRGKGAAEQWLDSQQEKLTLPDGTRDGVATYIVQQKLQLAEPAEVAAWISQRTQNAEIMAGIQTLALPYLRLAPQAAMTWMEGFSNRPGFPLFTAEVAMGQFATRDLEAAGNWLNEHQHSAVLGAYIWGYAMQAALTDAEGALAWVEKLPANGGWGVAAKTRGAGMAGMQNSMIGFEDHMTGGRGRDNLEYHILVAAQAGQLWRDPNFVPQDIPRRNPSGGQSLPFLRYNGPMLVKLSPEAEPVLTMNPHFPGGCHPCHTAPKLPFTVYVQQQDGSLVPAMTANR
jgi:hypothetical protein